MKELSILYVEVDEDGDKVGNEFTMVGTSIPTQSNSFESLSGKCYKIQNVRMEENDITCFIRQVDKDDHYIIKEAEKAKPQEPEVEQ